MLSEMMKIPRDPTDSQNATISFHAEAGIFWENSACNANKLKVPKVSPRLSIDIKRTTEHASFNKTLFQSRVRPLNHFSELLNRSEFSFASRMRISWIPSMSSLLFLITLLQMELVNQNPTNSFPASARSRVTSRAD
jgi:hypothetical protein